MNSSPVNARKLQANRLGGFPVLRAVAHQGLCSWDVILAKFCLERKQHFAASVFDTQTMTEPDINEVLAANLAHYMDKRGLTQAKLAKLSGVGQTTISLYLRPGDRVLGSKGKTASAKLTEVQMIAKAIGVPVWELVRDYAPGEREAHQLMESAFLHLRSNATPPPTPAASTGNRLAA